MKSTRPRGRYSKATAPESAEPLSQAACPPCFEPLQWDQWRMPLPGVRLPRPKSYCEDCTAEYQTQMVNAKRCLHPMTFFIRDADGFISGHRPPQPSTQEPRT